LKSLTKKIGVFGNENAEKTSAASVLSLFPQACRIHSGTKLGFPESLLQRESWFWTSSHDSSNV